MRKRTWILSAAGVLIASSVGLAYHYAIYLPGWISDWRDPVGPTRTIAWDEGIEPAPSGTRPPNIVLIVADDLGWNDISLHAGRATARVRTPNIDALARDGVTFSNGYAAHSTCAPSRAALLSGRYGTRFGFEFTPIPNGMERIVGALHDADPANLHKTYRSAATTSTDPLDFYDLGMPTEEVTIAELLKTRGYHTIHIGKWHLGDTRGAGPLDQGFDESLYMASGKYLPDDDPDAVNATQDFDPIDRFLWANFRFAVTWAGGQRFRPDTYLTDYFTEQAVAAINANRQRPFFLYLAHWAPHTPLQARKEDYEALDHLTDHRERVYAAMIKALDRSVGQVMDALTAAGLADDTLVMFTSDNGGAGYLGLPDINQPYRGWKLTFFEGGIRVPMLMRWPRQIPAGNAVHEPVHHFDLYATAAAAAGAALPADRILDGVDLLPWVRSPRNDTVAGNPDEAVNGRQRGQPHEALFWRSGHYQAVRAGRWKLQRSIRPEQIWLFDLARDPTERENVAARHPEKVAELLARLDRHNAEQAPPLWPALAELPVFIDKTAADPQTSVDEYVYVPN